MAKFNAPNRNIIEEDQTYESECQGSLFSCLQSNKKVLEICEYGDPVRNLKGGACSLHTETGSCSFPILPSPLNFLAGSCCRWKCKCPCPPVDTCLPADKCPPRPVESCMPGIHKQYRDVYSDCKESHLPTEYKTIVENDDIYLPHSHPLSSNSNCCNNTPTPSRSCSPPGAPPPTQSRHCACAQSQPHPRWDVQIPESKPCQEKKPSPKSLDPVGACHCLSSPMRLALPAPAEIYYFPPSPKCLPSAPKCIPSENICCFPISPKRLALPAPTDICCFPPSPERLTLPAPTKICRFSPSPKRHAFPAKVNQKSSKRSLALLARTDPCCDPSIPKLLALPARVSGGMEADNDITILPEPADIITVKSCVDINDQKPDCRNLSLASQKQVQRIYVCLPYHVNSLPTSPLKPLPSTDEKNPNLCSDFQNQTSLPSRCQECISQRPTPRIPKPLYIVEKPLQKSPLASPIIQPYIKSSFQISRISRVRDFLNSSCQYSPRERPKLFCTQKSGPSPPVSSDLSSDQNSTSIPSVYHFPKPMESIEAPHTKTLSPRPVNPKPLPAELVTVEKQHVQYNCSSREVTPVDVESAYLDQSCSRRPVSPSLYEAISRILRPESPRPMEILPRLAPSPRCLVCTCHKPLGNNRNNNTHFHYAPQIGSRSDSPPQSSNNFTRQYQRVENANITEFHNDVKRILKKDSPSRMRPADQNSDIKETNFHSGSVMKSETFPFRDFSSRMIRTDQTQEVRTIDRQQQEFTSQDFLSIVRATLKPEFPSSSSGRTTDRKQDPKLQELATPRYYVRKTDCKQEISSSFKATTERKQEYASRTTTERGTSPINNTCKPIMIDSSTNGARMEPMTAPVLCNSMNNEPPNKLQSGKTSDHMEKPSTSSSQEDIACQELKEEHRYGPMQANPKAADTKHPSRRNSETPSWMPRAVPRREEMQLRCCCGRCKSTHSRSRHFTTKFAYCGNVHSCCCGMCSCPFRYCPSKSPMIPNSKSSTSTTSAAGNQLDCNYPELSRPRSVSPMIRSYVAGIHEIPGKHGPRSKSASSKRRTKLHIKSERHPSPRVLLKTFISYLKSYNSWRSQTGLRCSHGSPQYWQCLSPERNCAQPMNLRSRPRKDQLQQQALWGTHPILLSNPRPSSTRFFMAQIPQPKLISGGPHRGCCCPRCAISALR